MNSNLNTLLLSTFAATFVAIAGCASEAADPPAAAGGGGTTAVGGAGSPAVGGAGAPAVGGAGSPAVGGAGSPAVGGAGSPGAGGVCDAPTTIFQIDGDQGCNGVICHTPENVGTYPPDLVSPGAAARLLDVVSTTDACMGGKYIDTANIENSLLLTKLVASPSCGSAMPFTKPALLPPDKVACIRSWIQSVLPQ